MGYRYIKGTPEDLIFFYKHLSAGGKLMRIDKPLLMYRYHPQCTTHDVDRLAVSLSSFSLYSFFSAFLQQAHHMEPQGEGSTRFCTEQMESLHNLECWQTGEKTVQKFGSTQPSKGESTTPVITLSFNDIVINRWLLFFIHWYFDQQVIAFCDVDAKKLALGCYTYEESTVSSTVWHSGRDATHYCSALALCRPAWREYFR